MALATIRLASTMIGDSALGRISPKTMPVRLRPNTSAACTNSRDRSDMNSARTTRVTGGQDTMAMAATMLAMEGVKIATSTTASTKLGTVWKNSVKRIATSSTSPPAYPAMAPRVIPNTSATAVETAPISNETLAPCAMPAATSRPRLSLPSRKPSSPGCANGAPRMSHGE